jgi:hypothetical protein
LPSEKLESVSPFLCLLLVERIALPGFPQGKTASVGTITFRAVPAAGKEFQVEIKRWLVSTPTVFQTKQGLIRVWCGLLKNFKGQLKKKDEFKLFKCPALHVLTKAFLVIPLLGKSDLL